MPSHIINPFNPKDPVRPELFAGRSEYVTIIKTVLSQTSQGQRENILITGERGIGKTSLAFFGRYLAENRDTPFLTGYVNAGRSKLSELCTSIIHELNRSLERLNQKTVVGKAKKKIRFYKFDKIELKVGPLEGSVSFRDNREDSNRPENFAYWLEDFWNLIQKKYGGLLLIIDEIDDVANVDGFATFWKGLFEKLSADGYTQIMFIFVGNLGTLKKMSQDHPSIPRVFTIIDLLKMSDKESLEVINKALEKVNTKIDPDVADDITRLSSGFPSFIQELCYHIFEKDTDEYLNRDDYDKGVEVALIQLGKKHFDKMYEVKGKNILNCIASFDKEVVERREILERVEQNQNTVDSYLRQMVDQGSLVKPKRACYRLQSQAFKAYINTLKGVSIIEEDKEEELE